MSLPSHSRKQFQTRKTGQCEVTNYNVTSPVDHPGLGGWIRAVDASGNRSALVPLPDPSQ